MAFFARYGHECPIKFVFLQRPPNALTGVVLKPYALNIVMVGPVAESALEFPPIPYSLTNEEVFTMTSKGIVHVVPGEPSVFIPLDRWMRESTIFKLLGNISFYKNFRLNKLFNLWRKNVNFRMYATKRLRLQSKLFLSKTAFCENSLTIHGMLHKMTSAPFIATKFNSGDLKRLSKIQIFLDHQDNIRKESREAMNVIVEEIHTLIEKTCKHVVDVSAKAAEEVEKEARGYFAEDAKRLPLVCTLSDFAIIHLSIYIYFTLFQLY